ncbi:MULTISPECIES: acyltransferase family protein [Gordonia]|uniref:Putative acetyltransferase n=1 Tax=Gordonia sihwensis NBRC 108236 TaxID=1223544 RepID=L7LKH8_9ACTN|nr:MULTISPECIES: acyltransferase [Gordonia]AUH67235.1 acyltransferase [Gordonia sp. YC-JH1]MBY4568948.1 acyltransferase [Gordonia sihwensis]GAC61645.1 putative acetyltransferase [Gordonia sihwensis NBRC 108236]
MSDSQPAPARRFYPQLEGLRAVASLGVLTTHVAFQTRATQWPVLGEILGRLDLAVALFFALSGFLLWRPYAAAARDEAASRPAVRRYLRHRFVRIWPAYALVVVAVLALLPQARGASATVWLANLTLTQVFVPLTLAPGLTQMWSLSVEVAFYLLLPVIGFALYRVRGAGARRRVPIIVGVAIVSLGWTWVTRLLALPAGVEARNWVLGYLPWFAVGLVLSEIAAALAAGRLDRRSRAVRLGADRRVKLVVFVAAYALACTPIAGPVGLGDMTHLAYVAKMALGAVAAFAVLAPLVLSDGPFVFLDSRVMNALGRWSYGIFIWHLAVLSVVFGLFGIPMFDGHFVTVWLLTVIITVALSAASYAFVEEPLRARLSAREKRRTAEVLADEPTPERAGVTAAGRTAPPPPPR